MFQKVSVDNLLHALKAHSDLIRQERADVGEDRHVYEGKHRPAPAVRFAPDDHQRRNALRAEGEEHHNGDGDGD